MIASVILHNAVYALTKSVSGKDIEEPVFFLIAVFGCPAAFLTGVVGSTVLFIRDITP